MIRDDNKVHLKFKMRAGDSISEVLRRLRLRPLWKKNGTIAKTAELNPLVIMKGNDLVSYGVTILLPATKLKPSQDYFVNEKTRYVTLDKPLKREIATPGPAIVQAPVIVPVIEKTYTPVDFAENDDFKNVIKLSYDINFTRLDGKDPSTGGTAVFASDFNHDIGLAYRRLLNKKWSVGGGADLNFATYTYTTTRKINGNSGTYINARVDAGYEFIPRFTAMGRISYAQRPFLKSLSSDVLQLDRVATIGIGTGVQWLAYLKGKDKGTLETGGGYLLPSSQSGYTIKSGYFLIGTARFLHDLDPRKSVDAAMYYRTDQQDTSILKDSTSELGFKVGFGYKF